MEEEVGIQPTFEGFYTIKAKSIRLINLNSCGSFIGAFDPANKFQFIDGISSPISIYIYDCNQNFIRTEEIKLIGALTGTTKVSPNGNPIANLSVTLPECGVISQEVILDRNYVFISLLDRVSLTTTRTIDGVKFASILTGVKLQRWYPQIA